MLAPSISVCLGVMSSLRVAPDVTGCPNQKKGSRLFASRFNTVDSRGLMACAPVSSGAPLC